MAIRTTDGTQYKRIPNVGDMYPTATGFQREVASYTATGGETSINLALLSPALSYMPGRHQLSIKRSSGGALMVGLDFTETSPTTVGFSDPLIAGEVIELTKEFTVTGVMAVEPRPDCYTATATTGQTLVTCDFSWPYNLNSAKAIGGVSVYLNGVLQTRGVDFAEVNLSAVNTNQVLFVDALLGGENIIVVPTYQAIDQTAAASSFNGQALQNIQSMMGAGSQGFVDQSTDMIVVPNTTIVGRAKIPNLANDLRASLGIERIATQSIVQLQNEFGPEGQPVYAAVNDDRGLIRFVGAGWSNSTTNSGSCPRSPVVGDYIEIVFYGTSVNLVSIGYDTTHNVSVYVDGTLSTSNMFGSSYSGIISSRNCSGNQIFPTGPVSILGIHTLRIVLNASNVASLYVQGFEILNANASGLVNINPGVGYLNGQKYVNSAADSIAYNTGVTGARGGRVVRYLNADGSVGQSFTAVNAAQANLTLADHTNEEVVRRHSYREFGAGGSEDFSLLKQADGSASRVFTLDDGTTTLSGRSVTHLDAAQVIGLAANPSFITITFVGTGLDLLRKDSGTGTEQTASVQVDGGAASNLSSANSAILRTEKIVSGLPYGTHTVKINWVSSTTYIFGLYGFTVYQPKKPTIPATALELCDYNVMADYALSSTTGTAGTISSGVLRKFATRENVYVGTWPALGIDVLFLCGYSVYTSTSGSYAEYVFFGTGINIKMYLGNSAQNFTLSVGVNGGSLSGNLSSYTSAFNYTGSGLTYTNTTGTVSGTSSGASGYNGAVFSLSGLPLGVHKVRFTLNNTTTTYVDAFDIITPIHSTKSNLYADLQNTLTVGSNSLMDSRKTSMVKETLPAQKAWAQAVGITNGPTSNVTYPTLVPMPDMSVTVKTNGRPIKIDYSVVCTVDAAGAAAFAMVYPYVNGEGVIGSQRYTTEAVSAGSLTISGSIVHPVAAGTHKVDLYWSRGGGTAVTADGTRRSLTVIEL